MVKIYKNDEEMALNAAKQIADELKKLTATAKPRESLYQRARRSLRCLKRW